jgi:hypothetical protein
MRFSYFVGGMYAVIAVIFLLANSLILGAYGYKWGHTEWSKWVFAIVAGAVPFALWPHLHVIQAKRRMFGHSWLRGTLSLIPLLLIYLIFVGYNVLGGTGATAFSRAHEADERAAVIDETGRLRQQRAALQAQYAGIPAHRPASGVEPLLDATKLHFFWSRTNECTDNVSNRQRRNFCGEVGQLKAELANARQADKLLAEIRLIDARLSEGKRHVSSEDPHTAFLGSLTGLSRDQILIIILLSTPLILEIGALYWGKQALELFGIHVIIRDVHFEQPPPRLLAAPSSVIPLSAAEEPADEMAGGVDYALPQEDADLQRAAFDAFWPECTRAVPGAKTAATAVYSAYRHYCGRRDVNVLPLAYAEFKRLSAERVQHVTRTSDVEWWSGFVLVEPMGRVA